MPAFTPLQKPARTQPKTATPRRGPTQLAATLMSRVAPPSDTIERAAPAIDTEHQPAISRSDASTSRLAERREDHTITDHLGPGQPLPTAARQQAEQTFSTDLTRVRIHAGHESSIAADRLDAHAFTHGNHIVFGERQWRPASLSGCSLLNHEIHHVIHGDDRVFRAPRAVRNVLTQAESGQDAEALNSANELVSKLASAPEEQQAITAALNEGLEKLTETTERPNGAAAARYVARRLAGDPGTKLMYPPRYIETSRNTFADNRTMELDMKLGSASRIDPKRPSGLPRFPTLGEHFFANFAIHYNHLVASDPTLSAADPSLQTFGIMTPSDLHYIKTQMAGFVANPTGVGMTAAQHAALEKVIGLASFHAAADTLNVEDDESTRYIEQGGRFKCNIYVTDFADLRGDDPYLPKQWWRDPEKLTREYVAADEISTVTNPVELMTPPTLNNWLRRWGTIFGWNAVPGSNPETQEREAQNSADRGNLVVFTVKTCITTDANGVCQDPTGGEGHSGVVAPQGSSAREKFDDSKPVGQRFVRSQAGERDRMIRQASGLGLNIFDGGHFDGGFWEFNPKLDESIKYAPVIREE